jgi:hypothetical protein
MSIICVLLRIARAVVENVIQVINAQVNMIADTVTDPLRQIVQAVIGGAWKGDGATRFAEEMNNEVIAEIANISGICTRHRDTIRTGMEIMTRAENQATSQAQQLNEVFSNIYR